MAVLGLTTGLATEPLVVKCKKGSPQAVLLYICGGDALLLVSRSGNMQILLKSCVSSLILGFF